MSVLLAFARERLPWLVFGPAIAALAASAIWAAWPDLSGTAATSSALALGSIALFVVRYRLWDDLADRDRDRASHPDRVVVRHQPAIFRAAGAMLFVGHAVLLATLATRSALVGLVVLECGFAVAYRWRDHLAPMVWRYPVLLSKYPAFVVVAALGVSATSFERLVAAALIVYAGAWLYEARHQPRPEGAWS